MMTRMADSSSPPRLVPLISGSGTTVLNLLDWIAAGRLRAEIPLVIASRECEGIERLGRRGVQVRVTRRKDFADTAAFSADIFAQAREARAEFIPLSGFLSRIIIPDDFQQRVVNIHPSLIPAFCGQGMYGHHVHEAVLARGCKISGCTVHFCDNEYDHGPIILQRAVRVRATDTPQSLAKRVFAAECRAYPMALARLLTGELQILEGRVHRVRKRPAGDSPR